MNKEKSFAPIGAQGHAKQERAEHDYYATDPVAADRLIANADLPHTIWEPCCGGGHLAKRFAEHGYNVIASDIIDRGYEGGAGNVDFFTSRRPDVKGDLALVTNPPFNQSTEFAKHALDILLPGDTLFLLLKLTWLQSRRRYNAILRDNPPACIHLFVDRIICARNGDFAAWRGIGSATAYAWYEWRIGHHAQPRIHFLP